MADNRGLDIDQVIELVEENTDSRDLGFLGEPGVNVLLLNLALDQLGDPKRDDARAMKDPGIEACLVS